ncbi:hypothetical protein PFISCL1PPCAC_11581, partial [Pristionchus fissidentatus]
AVDYLSSHLFYGFYPLHLALAWRGRDWVALDSTLYSCCFCCLPFFGSDAFAARRRFFKFLFKNWLAMKRPRLAKTKIIRTARKQ